MANYSCKSFPLYDLTLSHNTSAIRRRRRRRRTDRQTDRRQSCHNRVKKQ